VDLDSDTDSAVSSRWEETDEEKEEEEEEEVSGAATWAESKLALEPHATRTDEASIGALWCWLSWLLASAQLTDGDSRDPYHTRRAILPPLLRDSLCSGELQLLTFPLASPFGELWRERRDAHNEQAQTKGLVF